MADLLLSSGFLAFARHAGVLAAVEESGTQVDAVVGTSSGALVGALWSAGMPAAALIEELGSRRPLSLMALHARPWDGVFHLDPLLTWLRDRLPATFEELPRPFATGVRAPDGAPRLLTGGALPEAVAASCAIPGVFRAITLDGERLQDGGVVDRLMYGPWRAWRGERDVIAHVVDRMAGKDADDDLAGARVIRTPRSGASFWSLGDVRASAEEARRRGREVLG